MNKLSQWISGTVAPCRNGVYERRMRADNFDYHNQIPDDNDYGGYCKWDGKQWFPAFDTPESAANANTPSGFLVERDSVWRGLAEKPE